MILEETLNRLLRDTVDLILTTPGFSIKAKQKDAPRPQGSYASIDFLSDEALGWEEIIHANQVDPENLDAEIRGMRTVGMSIGFYRDNARDNARFVRTALARESVQELFTAAEVGLSSRSMVREISEAFNNGWEEKAQFDVFLSVVGTDADVVAAICSVDMAGEFQTRGLTYNLNIEV